VQIKFSKFIVVIVLTLNILFTVAVLYIFLRTGNEPVTLVASWFAFTVGELWMLAGIKRVKVKKEKGDENNEN